MDLAAHLGMTVRQLLREMTPRELALWRFKWNEDPWGEYREDLRSAQICQTLMNIHRDTKKQPTPFELQSFVLFKRGGPEAEEEAPKYHKSKTTIQPETISWLYAMAEKTKAKKQAEKKRAANGG